MGTRSRIGICHQDGSITSIYTHWDGYPRHHGPILIKHFSTEAKLRELMALGDLSSLACELGAQHPFENRKDHLDWCTAYGRDRGDQDVGARRSVNRESLIQLGYDYRVDFVYLFHPGAPAHQRWSVAELGYWQPGVVWQDLAVVCELVQS